MDPHFNLRKQAALKCVHTHTQKSRWRHTIPNFSCCDFLLYPHRQRLGHPARPPSWITTAPLCDHRIVLSQVIPFPPCWFDGNRDSKSIFSESTIFFISNTRTCAEILGRIPSNIFCLFFLPFSFSLFSLFPVTAHVCMCVCVRRPHNIRLHSLHWPNVNFIL